MAELRCGCGATLDVAMSQIGKGLTCNACRAAMRIVAPSFRLGPTDPSGLLVVRAGPHRRGEQVFLGGDLPIQIGKLPGSDIRLQGTSVSRSHCRLVRTKNGWRVEDESSTNGVYVNAHRVTGRDLQHGDRLGIGDFRFKFLNPSDASATAVPVTDGAAPPATPKPAVAARPAAKAKSTAPAKPTAGAPATRPAAPPAKRKPPPPPKEEVTYAVAEEVEGDDWSALASGGEKVSVAPAAGAFGPDGEQTAVAVHDHGITGEEFTGECPTCPCCENTLAPRAKVCVQCGINIKTGRSILTSQDTSLNDIYVAAEGVISWVSWIIWGGIYPIASEAFGTRKPHVVRAITAITIFTSMWFLVYEWTDSPKMRELKNLMLWAGEAEPDPDMVFFFYTFTTYGDSEAFYEALWTLEQGESGLSEEGMVLTAHRSLPRDQQYNGEYQASQLVTHAFLHAGILHLVGNLLFLLVFGSRVNAMLGNIGTAIVYPILAIGAAMAHMSTMSGASPTPMLGASGAIMGLAGMYFVFFPVHKVHMAAWLRWGLAAGFHLSLRLWSLRGFWVVLFYIAFDVVYTAAGVESGTAHWAHLGGFAIGVVIALILLFARLVNCRGGDLVSVLLGRHAWALVGRPNRG